MPNTLVPCVSCHRHAWSSESACPFCGGELEPPRPVRKIDARLGRAGLVLATSLTLAACGSSQPSPTGPGGDPVTDADGPGRDPADDGSEDPLPDADGPDEPPDMVAMYGAPAPEPGLQPPAPDDMGAPAPEYGAPMPPQD